MEGTSKHDHLSNSDINKIPLCSIIVPLYNGAKFVQECLLSVLHQRDVNLPSIELIVYDDASTDGSFGIVSSMQPQLCSKFGTIKLLRGLDGPQGCGAARNRACEAASSDILIFLDADDIMRETRVARSLRALRSVYNDQHVHIVGGVFDRIPPGSTPRYEEYHRRLRTEDLFAHAFRDTPLVFPTVACRKEVWEKVGGFMPGRGVPEDLHFFYCAMKLGFRMLKLQGESLTGYRFHDSMTSLALHRRTLLDVRVKAFEDLVLTLPVWKDGFSIWNSGRDGKEVFKRLSDPSKALVRAWGDVDPKKIGKLQHERPVMHFSQLEAPIVCCVALDRKGREFECNLASLRLRQGVDYVHLV